MKRIFAWVLVLALMAACLPAQVLATEEEYIGTVSLTVTDLVAGRPFPEVIIPADANYEILVAWQDTRSGENVTGTVQNGGSYHLNVQVIPNDGYEFANKVSIAVNGETAKSKEYALVDGILNFTRHLSLLKEIEKVQLPYIPTLDLGDTFPYKTGTGEGYTYVLGVLADGLPSDQYIVKQGWTYTVAVMAEALEGYEFTENTVFEVGGLNPTKFAVHDHTMFVDYRIFNFGPGAWMKDVLMVATLPDVGQMGGDVIFGNESGYTVNSVTWLVSSDDTYFDVSEMISPLKKGQRILLAVNLTTKSGFYFSTDLNIKFNGRIYHPIWFEGTREGISVIIDVTMDNVPIGHNGLAVVSGVWGYYQNGYLQTNYTGLVKYEGNMFYVENGILTFDYTGLVWYQDAWRYVANSQLTEGYTGLVWFNDNWFYTVDSVIDWTFTGLVPYEGNYFYVQNNLLDWSYTGLGYHDGGWYFIQNGLLQKEYSGLVYFNDNWFYVEEGELTYQYFGMVEYEGNLFYVQASHLDWNYTGLGYHAGAWYYFQNALYTPSFTGLVPFDGSLFYVKNGTVDWSYNGTATYDGVEYTIENGVAK